MACDGRFACIVTQVPSGDSCTTLLSLSFSKNAFHIAQEKYFSKADAKIRSFRQTNKSLEKYFSKIMKNFPIIDINQRKEGKKPIPTPARGREMDGKRMRNENGKG